MTTQERHKLINKLAIERSKYWFKLTNDTEGAIDTYKLEFEQLSKLSDEELGALLLAGKQE